MVPVSVCVIDWSSLRSMDWIISIRSGPLQVSAFSVTELHAARILCVAAVAAAAAGCGLDDAAGVAFAEPASVDAIAVADASEADVLVCNDDLHCHCRQH